MSNDKKVMALGWWSARRSKRAFKPFDKMNGCRLCAADGIPGVRVRMYGTYDNNDNVPTSLDFSVKTEDAVMLGEFLVTRNPGESLVTTVYMEKRHPETSCVVEMRMSCVEARLSPLDGFVVLDCADHRLSLSGDCAGQLGRTFLTLAFPDDWHSFFTNRDEIVRSGEKSVDIDGFAGPPFRA